MNASRTLILGFLPLCTLACGGGGTTGSGGAGPSSSSSSTTSSTGGTGGAGGTGGTGGICGVAPTKSGAACVLPASITADMKIGSECQPWHIAAAGTQVTGSSKPTLTIEPCVTIEVDPGGYLSVAGQNGPGALVAVGSAAQPITFTSSAPTPAAGDWGGIGLLDGTVYPTTTLQFVDIAYGGQMGNLPSTGTLVVDSTQPELVLLHDLTLSNNLEDGIHLMGPVSTTGIGFAAGSGNLTIKDWGTGRSPILLDLGDAAATVPATLTTGTSGHDGQVELNNVEGVGVVVDVTQTWPSIPIPYLLDAPMGIAGVGTSSATLTIAAPNVIQSMAGGEITVDPDGTDQGYLVANGTTGNLVFTSSSTNPSAGDWQGIFFQVGSGGQGASSLTFCTIEYAGATQQTGACGVPAPVVVRNDTGSSSVVGPTITGNEIQDFGTTDHGIDVDGSVSNAASYANNTIKGTGPGLSNVCQM